MKDFHIYIISVLIFTLLLFHGIRMVEWVQEVQRKEDIRVQKLSFEDTFMSQLNTEIFNTKYEF